MKKLDKYYNEEYTKKAFYVVTTALITFVLGLIIYYLAGKTGTALSFVSGVLKPLILGLVFTYLLSPVVKNLESKPFSGIRNPATRKVAAVVSTFIIVLMALGLILGILAVTVTKSLSAFNPAEFKEYLLVLADQFSKFWTTIEKQLASMNINLGSGGVWLGKIFNGVKNGASTLLFAVIFAVYFLLDEKIFQYWADVLKVFANEKTRDRLHVLSADANRVFSGYIRGQSMDAAIVGSLVSIALLIAGVPYAVVIGILTGLGNLVPYVGPVVGFGSLIIVCLAEGSFMHLLIGGIILAAVMFIDGNIINPRMLSSNVEVHPVLVIIALLAGGKIGGVVGMLVAVPVAALLKLQFERYVEKRKALQ
ncbi:MAG: AI-2E family transporter [Mogibacterium sp.]|nr:AI-2E family transporter [Mogibacterium sp.]MBQ6501148.1 AI-2E family transporter [Mogibacterium sp.]